MPSALATALEAAFGNPAATPPTSPATAAAAAEGMANAINTNTGVPIGGIIPAYLSAGDITTYFTAGLGKAGQRWAGFAICNGANSTPSLAGKFPRFSTTAAGGTGGADTMAHTHAVNLPSESFTSGSTTLATTQIPSHTHAQYVTANPGTGGTGTRVDYNADGAASTAYTQGINTGATGGGGGHTHSITHDHASVTSGAASNTENRPAYYELVPLMRVS